MTTFSSDAKGLGSAGDFLPRFSLFVGELENDIKVLLIASVEDM